MTRPPSMPSAGEPAAGPMPRQHQKMTDRLVLLVLGGLFAFTPPLLLTVNKALLIFGVPLLYLWLAGVWMLLIVGVFWLNRHLKAEPPTKANPPAPKAAPAPPQLPPMGD